MIILHSLEALHKDGSECCESKVIRVSDDRFLGIGVMVAALEHDGTTAWNNKVSKMVVSTY